MDLNSDTNLNSTTKSAMLASANDAAAKWSARGETADACKLRALDEIANALDGALIAEDERDREAFADDGWLALTRDDADRLARTVHELAHAISDPDLAPLALDRCGMASEAAEREADTSAALTM